MRDDFAIFICTHGRPDKQLTLNALRKCGYTGSVYLVLDDTDETIQQYIDNFDADMLLVFDKQHYIDTNDVGSLPPNFKTILYAKNAVEDMAQSMKLKGFVIADDDIYSFRIRLPKDEDHLSSFVITDIDGLLSAYCDFMFDGNFTAVGICGSVHFVAGRKVFESENIQKYRVPYNFIFRNADHKMEWVSSFGEDIITAMEYNKRGHKILDIPYFQYDTIPPGRAIETGGMSDLYNSMSQFTLCCYDHIYNPSSIKLCVNRNRWNAQILKNYVYPKIISQSYRKEE